MARTAANNSECPDITTDARFEPEPFSDEEAARLAATSEELWSLWYGLDPEDPVGSLSDPDRNFGADLDTSSPARDPR